MKWNGTATMSRSKKRAVVNMSFAVGFAAGVAVAKKKFGGGGGDKPEHDWDYQKWLDLPEPNDNQAVFLIQAADGFLNCYFYIGYNDYDSSITEDGFSIDWGDGSDTEIFAANIMAISHLYAEPGEYVVTFTHIYKAFGIGKYNTGSAYARIIMAKYGRDILIPNNSSGFADCRYLRYVRLSPDVIPSNVSTGFFSRCFSLKEIEWEGTITELTQNMFFACYNLNFDTLNFDINSFDIPSGCFESCFGLKIQKLPTAKITSIGYQAFYGCQFTSINLPNCTSIGAQAFSQSRSLKEIIAPNCTFVDQYAFNTCLVLSKAIFSEECTFGSNCFTSCYGLYPKPDGSIN